MRLLHLVPVEPMSESLLLAFLSSTVFSSFLSLNCLDYDLDASNLFSMSSAELQRSKFYCAYSLLERVFFMLTPELKAHSSSRE